MTRRLILLRHGQTSYNATRRMQGHLDTELSDVGRQQARDVAAALAGTSIAKIVSSDLMRAADTASAVAAEVGHPEIDLDSRLRETHLGEWQGMNHQEVDAGYPGVRALWREDATWAPPGGESRIDVARRARPVVEELMTTLSEWDDSTVLMVAHGGTISALTSNLLEFDVEQYPLFSGLGNTAASVLTARPRSSAEQGSGVRWYLNAWNLGGAL